MYTRRCRASRPREEGRTVVDQAHSKGVGSSWAFEKHRSPQSLPPEMRQLVMFFPESLLLTLWYILPFGNQLCIKKLCNYVTVLLRPHKIKSHLINKETNNSGGDGYRFSLPWAGQKASWTHLQIPIKIPTAIYVSVRPYIFVFPFELSLL